MTAIAPLGPDRRNQERRDTRQSCPRTVEQLVGDTRVVLANCGIQMGQSKVSRLVRTFKHEVEGNGFEFAAYVANAVAVHEDHRRTIAAHLVRVITYADPTGETAVANVMRGAA